jgi:peptide/nickel transport system permease protein
MIESVRASRVLLWIGGCLLAIFVVTAVLGPYVAPYSPDYKKPLRFVEGKPVTSPEPPSAKHWLGKDQRGRDVLTLMLYGLKYTLFFVLLVSLFRVMLGGVIGVWSGMRNGPGEAQETPDPKEKGLLSLSGLFGGIPAIFLLVYLLEPMISSLSFEMTILVQGAIIAAFGVAPVASAVAEQTRKLKNRLFVLDAKTMGATRGWLIRRHILPMLKEKLVILFVQEMILVLNTLGQLSVFTIFL